MRIKYQISNLKSGYGSVEYLEYIKPFLHHPPRSPRFPRPTLFRLTAVARATGPFQISNLRFEIRLCILQRSRPPQAQFFAPPLCMERFSSRSPKTLMLRHEPQPHRKRAPLPSPKRQIIWCVYIVHHRIRILVPDDVDSRYPHRPFVSSKLKSLFKSQIQAQILWKAQPVRRADQLLLLVQHTEWESRAVLEKFA